MPFDLQPHPQSSPGGFSFNIPQPGDQDWKNRPWNRTTFPGIPAGFLGQGGPNAPNATSSPAATIAEAQAWGSQGAVNQQTNSNRPSINTPFGNQQWSQDANGNWTMNNSLAPGMQGAAGALEQQLSDNYSKPMDDGSAARDQAITSAYGQSTKRLDPRFSQEQEQLGSQLAQQGLDPNSQAYRTAMQQESNSKNDAYGSAMNSAIGQGTAAQQAVFNQNMQARNAPLQELQAMQGFSNNMPGFNAAGQAQGPNYLGAYQMQYAQDQQNAANNSQTWNAIGGVGAKLGSAAVNLFGGGGRGGGVSMGPDAVGGSQPGGQDASPEGDYPAGGMPSGGDGGSYALRQLRPFSLGPNWSQQ